MVGKAKYVEKQLLEAEQIQRKRKKKIVNIRENIWWWGEGAHAG